MAVLGGKKLAGLSMSFVDGEGRSICVDSLRE
jgi:hypothetical protein